MNSQAITRHQCCACKKVFESQHFLFLHIRNRHSQLLKQVSTAQGKQQCSFCAKVFISLKTLYSHLQLKHSRSFESSAYAKQLTNSCSSIQGYVCKLCNKACLDFASLRHHIAKDHHSRFTKESPRKHFICHFCGKVFDSHKWLEVHVVGSHRCSVCSKYYPNSVALKTHEREHIYDIQQGGNIVFNVPNNYFSIVSQRGRFRVYKYRESENSANIMLYFNDKCDNILQVVRKCISEIGPIKLQIRMQVQFYRDNNLTTPETFTTFLNSYMRIILNSAEANLILSEMYSQLAIHVDRFEKFGSGWKLHKIKGFDLQINKFKPLGGGCYATIPAKVYNKKCVVNVYSTDSQCFKWSVLACLFPSDSNKNRVSAYSKHEHKLVWKSEWFPTNFKHITDFECCNNIAVNCFSWSDDEGLIPVRISQSNYKSDWQTVNLLVLNNFEKDLTHFAAINNLSKLTGKHNHHKKLLCFNCLQQFSKSIDLENHITLCKTFKTQKVNLPKEIDGKKPVLKFNQYSKQLKAGFVLYVDFECLIIPTANTIDQPTTTKLHKESEHVPCSFAYALVRDDGQLIKEFLYRDADALEVFYKHLVVISGMVAKLYHYDVGPTSDDSEWEKFWKATDCHICNKQLEDDRCFDHCHRTGKFRGASHTVCNLNYQQQKKIPVILHGFRNYDSHLIVQGLKYFDGKIDVIPNNSERFLSLISDNFYFIDSYQFLNSSLEVLTKNLLQCDAGCDPKLDRRTKLDIMYQCINEEERIGLLIRKGVYCYEYMDDENKFKLTSLPSIEKFYNRLNNEECSIEDFNHALHIWKVFNCKTLGDYHDVYLRTDVLLLACIFENFRSVALSNFKLDPVHFYSLPGLSWACGLRSTGVELELLTDIDMNNFIQNGIRGGMSLISHRYAHANNPYMESFKEDEEKSYLMYLDKNSLYGTAMCDYLPVSNFEWLDSESVATFDVMAIKDDNDFGYILEVDLEYPDELHDVHNSYPMAPERMEVTKDMISEYQKHLCIDGKFHVSEKLIGHLGTRTKYAVHYRNLKFYISQGMKLTKVHRILKFKQHDWLKSFILLNINLRKLSKSEFEKSFYKWIINAFFGKTCENVRKHCTTKFSKDHDLSVKYASDTRCKQWDIIDDDLIMFSMEKKSVLLNKPIYVGFTILELSKVYMFDFHYNIWLKRYKNKSTLLASDTDSLMYHVRTDDVYKDMKEMEHLYDTSDYPKDHFLYSVKNKKELGKMKDEAQGKILEEFIGLSSKMYSISGNNLRKKACKGTKKSVINQLLHHDKYIEALYESKKIYTDMIQIRSFKHKIYSVSISNKLSLNCLDLKRFILDDGISTLAFNHYRIRNITNKS